ncbi:Phenylacetate-CoA oxygenase/reductase, PaaK subunit [metagenome]|uniref:Phenylacetate-CoA oxygenase/reductase, PaaK subunit n=1 Tax=metagenome TaxID=256318 RepID=A0A2P2C9N5_9ZZZZ
MSHAVFHELIVAAVEPLTEDSVLVTFEVPAELSDDYAFTQGQHVAIRWHGARRNYSICSPVGGPLRIGVKHIPDGEFSAYALERMRPGAALEVMTPSGHFTTELDPRHSKGYAMIAAGSGITPILSNLATILAVEPGSTITLLYGNRTMRSVMFLRELEDLQRQHPDRLRILHFLTREAGQSELFSGRLDDDRIGRVIAAGMLGEIDEWFLCGPFEMVTGGREVLLASGVDAAHVHVELFHATALARPPEVTAGVRAKVTATLDGRASDLEVGHDQSILDAMLEARADAPYACKGGMCGTCRARLLSGEVEMATNFALEPDDLARGYVLTCQSYPTTDEVVVDYDG